MLIFYIRLTEKYIGHLEGFGYLYFISIFSDFFYLKKIAKLFGNAFNKYLSIISLSSWRKAIIVLEDLK